MEPQSLYQKAIAFAGEKHQDQKVPGTQSSYLVHLSNVAMETMMAAQHTDDFDLGYAVQVALLHDVLEDTSTTFEELKEAFGEKIAEGVLALSKNEDLEPDFNKFRIVWNVSNYNPKKYGRLNWPTGHQSTASSSALG